jgi:hypothetical protein
MKTTALALLIAISVLQGYSQSTQEEKRYFDFLIGTWQLESYVSFGKSGTGDDTYKFSLDLSGHAINSEWHFNRGTVDKPEVVHARYYSAFDISKSVWTFYYISEKSAQYWEGKKEDGQWNFYQNFSDNGQPRLQRQTWIAEGKDILIRVISNSRDGGKTWSEDFRGVFKRK